MTEQIAVIVIGGGYAGILAANRLTQRDDVAVTLVNPRPTFVERIRLHQHVAGTRNAVLELDEVLATRIRVVVDNVTHIDAAERSVRLASGDALDYDYLVYAVGSVSAAPEAPGAAEFAYPIATLEAAERLRSVLDDAPADAAVTVVGAGPTGIETAAELAELGRRVTLICGGVLGPYLHPRARRAVAGRLAALGVTVVDGPETKATAVTDSAVTLRDGRRVPSNVTVWTAGFGVPDVATRSGLRTDEVGRLLTDETLTSVDDDRIVAAGDAAAPSALPFRMSCQAAVQLGPYAADTVLSRISGRRPAPIAVGLAAQCISLGRRAGIYQFAGRSDEAIALYVGGRAGATVKEIICSGIVKMLVWEARRPGLLRFPTWVRDPRRHQALRQRRDGVAAGRLAM